MCCSESPLYNVIECGKLMVMALTPDAVEAMCAQVIHLSPTVETSMRMTEGGAKAEAHRNSYSVIVHPQAERGDGQGIQPGT